MQVYSNYLIHLSLLPVNGDQGREPTQLQGSVSSFRIYKVSLGNEMEIFLCAARIAPGREGSCLLLNVLKTTWLIYT